MVFCHSLYIYRTWRNIQVGEGEILKSSFVRQVTKRWGHFLWGELTLEAPCTNFILTIGGGLGWVKWLKNGVAKGFIFDAVTP